MEEVALELEEEEDLPVPEILGKIPVPEWEQRLVEEEIET